ncbi:MAG TPA: hypothetical protein VGX23_02885 [Actinocrinis sp.]|nr:hypothetical protein [Actinocrinis sp.]
MKERTNDRRITALAFGLVALAGGAATSACSSTGGVASVLSSELPALLSDIRNGVDAAGDVSVGPLATDADGRSTTVLSVRNTTGDQESYAVQVNFKDPTGKILDMVVVTVGDVPAGAGAHATARSTYALKDPGSAAVGLALRH